MLGPEVRRFTLRTRRWRLAGAVVAAAGLISVGAITASAQIALPTATPTVCLLNTCLLGGTSSSPTPTPTPLCLLLICNPTDPGTGTTGTSTPTPTPCPITGACLPAIPTCSVTDPLNCIAPSPSGCSGTCTPNPSSSSSSSSSSSRSNSRSSSSSSSAGGFGSLAFGGAGGGGGGGGQAVPLDIRVAAVPVTQEVSPVSGLQFGNAPILWPLFGILDVLGLAVVFAVVRRLRSADAE